MTRVRIRRLSLYFYLSHHGRLDVFAVDEIAVLGHVPRRVHQVLHVTEEALVLAGQLLPRLLESRDCAVAQARDDVEHGVEVFALLALTRHFDELLDGPHPPDEVRLRAHLRHDPKHFAIHQLRSKESFKINKEEEKKQISSGRPRRIATGGAFRICCGGKRGRPRIPCSRSA